MDITTFSKNLENALDAKKCRVQKIASLNESMLHLIKILDNEDTLKEFSQLFHKAALADATAKGENFGRKLIQTPENFEQAVKQWENKEINIDEALRLTGLGIGTFRRRVKQYRAKPNVAKPLNEKAALTAGLAISLHTSLRKQRFKSYQKQRMNQGYKAAKEKGSAMGRSKLPIPKNFEEIINKWENKEITRLEAISLSGLPQGTFYNRLKEYRMGRASDGLGNDG